MKNKKRKKLKVLSLRPEFKAKIKKSLLFFVSSRRYFLLSLLFHLFFASSLFFKDFFLSWNQRKKPQAVNISLLFPPLSPSPSPFSMKKPKRLPEKRSSDRKNKKKIQSLQKAAFRRLDQILSQKNVTPSISKRAHTNPNFSALRKKMEDLIKSLEPAQRERLFSYLMKIQEKLYANWSLPSWLDDSQLKTHIAVSIDEKGEILKKKILIPSKNKVFNKKALNTIEKASPLPPPPKDLLPILSQGLILQFPR